MGRGRGKSERGPGSGGKRRSSSWNPGYKSWLCQRSGRGLARIVGLKWGKLGAWRRCASLTCRAVAAAAAGVESGREASPEQQDKPPGEDKIKMPGLNGNSSRKGVLGSAGTPKAGETESGGSTVTMGGVITQSCCLWTRSPPFAGSRGPLPSPLFLRI